MLLPKQLGHCVSLAMQGAQVHAHALLMLQRTQVHAHVLLMLQRTRCMHTGKYNPRASEAYTDWYTNPDTILHHGNMASFTKKSQSISYYGQMRQLPRLHQAGLCHVISYLLQKLEKLASSIVYTCIKSAGPAHLIIAVLAAKNKRDMDSIGMRCVPSFP